MPELLLKSTVVLVLGVVGARLCRSAAVRHLVWLSTLIGVLLLPLSALLPEGVAPLMVVRVAGISNGVPVANSGAAVPWLLGIWGAGAAFLLARLVVDAVRVGRIVKRSRTVSRTPEYVLRVTDDVSAPVAWQRSVILPPDAEQWPATALQAAIDHEAAHVARRDCYALLIAQLACAIYWFHPLVWYAARRLRMEQEHAADDHVVSSGADAAEYASELLGIVKAHQQEALFAGVGCKTTLGVRIQAILDRNRRRTVQTRRMLLASAVAILAVVIPLAGMQPDRKVYSFKDDGVKRPEVIHKVEPQYTPEAREAKIMGSVLLSAVIETDGKLSDVQVKRGLDPGLDNNAVGAVKTWVFKPAEKDGAPVAVACQIEINFRLD